MDWTEQQKEAITRRDSGLIVSAAAGSGKTSVLVERLLRILMDESPENKVPADHMIVVTFTNDAAAEMRSRLYQALDQKLQEQPENTWLYQQQIRLQNAHICTISSFCFELIRENLGDQGITAGFRILSETESKMMTSKAADVVLNQWHTDRAEDMQLLWNSFCEKDDTDLERLLLELHKFLGTVPFRENWVQQVQQELQKPLEDSTYYQMLSAGMEQNLQMILWLANEAADTASELYESVTDNKALAWIEADVHMLEQTLRMMQQQESDAEKLLEPYAKLKQERTGKRFSSSKKGLLNEEALARAKSLREMYKGMIEDVALQIETIYPYTAEDLAQTAQLMPLLLELEEQISAEIWKEKVRQNALSFDDAERMALNAFGNTNVRSVTQICKDWYGHQGAKGDTLREVHYSLAHFAASKMPTTMNYRYVTEDVPFGLIPSVEFFKQFGFKYTTHKALVDVLCAVCARDFYKEARTMEQLGIAGMDREQLMHYLETGK